MLQEEARDPEKVERAASRALKTCLDRFVRLRGRQAESAYAEPGLLVRERQVVYEYRITVHAEGAGVPVITEIDSIPGAKGKTWSDLENGYPLIRQDGGYIEKVFTKSSLGCE